jgi:glycerophosphoryl diester phosphodiesterase
MASFPGHRPGKPRLYAHRGAAHDLPENTLPAFRRALDVGATALETDVHRTRDGQLVLSHDPTGDRAAAVPRRIGDATFAEVRSWDVGTRMRARRPDIGAAPFTMPTLEELLVETAGVRLNVDLKQHDAATVEAAVALIRKHQAQDRVLLASFDSATLHRVRSLGYEGETGMGRAEALHLAFSPEALCRAFPLRCAVAQLPTHFGPIRLDRPAFIAKVHALGLLIHYWTIDDPREAVRLLALGADGIMTDDPAAIAPVFAGLPA